MKERKRKEPQLVIYRNWLAMFIALSIEQKGIILDAISKHVILGVDIDVEPALKPLVEKLLLEIDESMKHYENVCEIRKQASDSRKNKRLSSDEQMNIKRTSYDDHLCPKTKTKTKTNDTNVSNKESISKDIPKKNSFSLNDANRILDSYDIVCNYPEIRDSFLEYLKMRRGIKKPITSEKALRLNLDKAIEYGGSEPAKVVQIINNAIEHSWQGIYPPKENKAQSMFDVIANFNGGDELGEY